MKTLPIDKHIAPKYIWGDNCESFVLMDTSSLSIKQEMMPPNTREKLHYHTHAQQFFYVIKGEASFYIDNEEVIVKPGQGIQIQAGKQHYIENKSTIAIEFLVISEPSTNNDRITIE